MILGMLTGAILVIVGILIGLKIKPQEETQVTEDYPTTVNGKFYSARTAIREATGESDD